jgi:hypothetical protein
LGQKRGWNRDAAADMPRDHGNRHAPCNLRSTT